MATKPHTRSTWLVGAVSLVTLNLYGLVWLGMTWSEMKRELKDETMHPFWHAMTMFVPIYNLFRIHAHYRTISELQARPVFMTELVRAEW